MSKEMLSDRLDVSGGTRERHACTDGEVELQLFDADERLQWVGYLYHLSKGFQQATAWSASIVASGQILDAAPFRRICAARHEGAPTRGADQTGRKPRAIAFSFDLRLESSRGSDFSSPKV